MLSGEDRSVIEALHHAWLAAEVEGNGDSALLQLCYNDARMAAPQSGAGLWQDGDSAMAGGSSA